MSEQGSSNRVEREYMELMAANTWFQLYQRLGMETDRHQFTWNEAKKPKNKTLNRYRDVNPYDHSRVALRRCENDYINANFVTLERANRRYILTQGPLAFTRGHFWLMIWEQNSKAILMLNKIIEKNEVKCCRYWPEFVGEEEKCEDVGLNVTLIKEEDCGYYFTRVIRIFDYETETTRDVVQYHYTTWPDFGVPSSPTAFLRFLMRVRETGVLDPTDGPPVIHCSAGIGRSGTLCLVDCCLVIVEREGIDHVDIQATLTQMRRDRMGLIQTPDQLRFCYQAVLEGAKRLDPNWEEQEDEHKHETEESVMTDSVYSFVQLEETPPPPPPRAESLTRAPARPLPAIPTSTSLGNINLSAPQESSSSDETPPTPPVRDSPTPTSSADDEADEPSLVNATESGGDTTEPTETLRKRRNRELAERLSVMKKRARETERWHSFKRSLYKPISITLGFILAGIIIYAYVKH